MDCPKPRCYGSGEAGKHLTEGDHMHVQGTGHFSKSHPLLAMVSIGVMGAKAAFSTTYKCRSCGHVWRKWG